TRLGPVAGARDQRGQKTGRHRGPAEVGDGALVPLVADRCVVELEPFGEPDRVGRRRIGDRGRDRKADREPRSYCQWIPTLKRFRSSKRTLAISLLRSEHAERT